MTLNSIEKQVNKYIANLKYKTITCDRLKFYNHGLTFDGLTIHADITAPPTDQLEQLLYFSETKNAFKKILNYAKKHDLILLESINHINITDSTTKQKIYNYY